MPRTADNGYGTAHTRLRKQWASRVERGDVACRRCRKLITPKGLPCSRCGKVKCGWDLGHDDWDRTLPAEPEHECCNSATATHHAKLRGSRVRANWW